MIKNTKYLITGKKGLLGSSFIRELEKRNEKFLGIGREECDILNYKNLLKIAENFRPDVVINCAALVGGIKANKKYQYDFFEINNNLQNNVLRLVKDLNIPKVVLINSNCAYPANAKQPYLEKDFLNGSPQQSNLGYASAKRMGLIGGNLLEEQYGIKTYHPIPCSLYGVNDNFNLENSHFVAAAIRKIAVAKNDNRSEITFWGSGTPKREFMYVDDAIDGILYMLKKDISSNPVNICWGEDAPIKDVINILSKLIGYEGIIKWDRSKPDGALQKLQNPTLLKSLGWEPSIKLEDGLKKTLDWYNNCSNIRL